MSTGADIRTFAPPPLTDSGRGVAPSWDFEAKNVPNLINVIVNDKFRIRNL